MTWDGNGDAERSSVTIGRDQLKMGDPRSKVQGRGERHLLYRRIDTNSHEDRGAGVTAEESF